MGGKFSYTAVGVFVVSLVVAAIAIFFWLALRKHDQQYTQYVVFLHEEVSGLSVQGPVRYNGVPVGYVKSISLVPSNPQLVRVMLNIEEGTPINTSTVATLMSQGITGVDYIGLQSEQVNAPPLAKHKGEEYPVIASKPSLLMQLSEVMPKITGKITELSDSVTKLFDQSNLQSIAVTLKNLQAFTSTLKHNSERINDSMASLQKILSKGQIAANKLPALMQTTSITMKQLKTTATTFNHTAETATNTLKAGRAAIDGFSTQLIPSAQQVLQRLGNITVSLTAFSNELKRNPAMMIRGKQPMRLGPGEKR